VNLQIDIKIKRRVILYMEKATIDKILTMIKGIEKKNLQFEKYLLNLKIPSRNTLLKEITFDIIRNNNLLQQIQIDEHSLNIAEEKMGDLSITNYIDETMKKIQDEPSKKIIFLREFLNKLEGITENDLTVLLKSLKNKDSEDLRKELMNLANIFNLKITD
jgi:hypothetical protein